MIQEFSSSLLDSSSDIIVLTADLTGEAATDNLLGFKQIYPEAYYRYRVLCDNGKIELGIPHYIPLVEQPWNHLAIFPIVKKFHEDYPFPETLTSCFESLVSFCESNSQISISFSPLFNSEIEKRLIWNPYLKQITLNILARYFDESLYLFSLYDY
jgi:hypothetical protein